MFRARPSQLVLLPLVLLLLAAGVGRADYPCPEPQPGLWHPVGLHYQQHSYVLPQVHRVLACFRPRQPEIYVSDLHPEVPPGFDIQQFPCPFATPVAIYAAGRRP
jgi:hypothetical protein